MTVEEGPSMKEKQWRRMQSGTDYAGDEEDARKERSLMRVEREAFRDAKRQRKKEWEENKL